MTAPGNFNTETFDMIAVHQALLGSLDAGHRPHRPGRPPTRTGSR